MLSPLRCVVLAFIWLFFVGSSSFDAAPMGFVEGHLTILPATEVELAEGTPSKFGAVHYTDFPLVVSSCNPTKETVRVTADDNGNYRIALPPGDYVLDVHDRRHRHLRAKPQPFTVVANQTVRVDMTIDSGIR